MVMLCLGMCAISRLDKYFPKTYVIPHYCGCTEPSMYGLTSCHSAYIRIVVLPKTFCFQTSRLKKSKDLLHIPSLCSKSPSEKKNNRLTEYDFIWGKRTIASCFFFSSRSACFRFSYSCCAFFCLYL